MGKQGETHVQETEGKERISDLCVFLGDSPKAPGRPSFLVLAKRGGGQGEGKEGRKITSLALTGLGTGYTWQAQGFQACTNGATVTRLLSAGQQPRLSSVSHPGSVPMHIQAPSKNVPLPPAPEIKKQSYIHIII